MRIALFTPLPPERTGIADYAALLLPALRERADITVVKRGTKRPPRGTDLSVYHIGNNPEVHGWIVEALRRTPGAVVLHEFVLHHLVSGMTLARGDSRGYLDALERDGGLAARLLGYAVMEKRIPPLWENRAVDLPLAATVLDHALGVVAHSEHVKSRVRATGFERPVDVVPHPAWAPPSVTEAGERGAPLIAAFGFLNESKRVPQLLEAFARLRADHPGARLMLVGAPSPNYEVGHYLQRLGLDGDGVSVTGYVDEVRLWSLMEAADVHVNLRAPTMGETSGTAIRALSLGKPLVVSDLGWFSELPDDVALKVPVDETEVDTLAAALELLASHPEVRGTMGVNAQALASTRHAVGAVADGQIAAFERIAGGGVVADDVLAEVSRAAAEVGIEPRSEEAAELARRLSEVDLGA
ncbi:MAG: glycosyltransferase [Gaiellales bacterium]